MIVGERFDLLGWLGLVLVAVGILLLVLPGRRGSTASPWTHRGSDVARGRHMLAGPDAAEAWPRR